MRNPEIIEGEWDELVSRQDLRGRRVRIIVLDDEEAATNPWVSRLRDWADRHEPLRHSVDDSRDSIYSGTADDPR